jgi:class 3 adenylate cyclase
MRGSYPHTLPDDEVLAEAARALEDGFLAGEILDERWRLVYVSTELRNLVGCDDDAGLAYGSESLLRGEVAPDVWRLDETSRREWAAREAPYTLSDLSEAEARELFGERAHAFLAMDPQTPPVAFAARFRTTFADLADSNMSRLVVRLRRADGSLAGLLGLYVGGGLRASVQAMLSRGDAEMFERMAELTEPERRPAAVLFADLESSGVLSRRLSSRAYFALVRELTTAIDGAVVDAGGIVGKHAGDGVSAFFLAEQCGGRCAGDDEAGASEAALEAALCIRRSVAAINTGTGPAVVNIGLHWGATLVIGQIVTGGRLEVTALGDEVNEAARVQEVARGGQLLATKDLIERLPARAAETLDLDIDGLAYEILAEIPGAGEKARRDAGGLAVCTIPA